MEWKIFYLPMKIIRRTNRQISSGQLMELKVHRITELLFIWVIHKIHWIDIFIEPCIIFNMVRFSKITHIQLIATEKHLNSTCYTKLKFLIHFRWATRAIFKWPVLDPVHDYPQRNNSEVRCLNLKCLSVAVKIFLGSAVIIL